MKIKINKKPLTVNLNKKKQITPKKYPGSASGKIVKNDLNKIAKYYAK